MHNTKIKKDIKNKLSVGVPVNDIYMETGDNHGNSNSRKNIHNNGNINKSHLIEKNL